VRTSVLAILALSVACSTARRRVDGTIVRHIGFEGNGGWFSGHDDYTLAEQMSQDESRWGLLTWPFVYTVEPRLLDRDVLLADAYRLEVWYAHHGWFDARFDGWQLRDLRRPTDGKAGVVDVWGLVTPGPRSFVRSLDVRGLPPALDALRRPPLGVGAPFELDLVETTRAALLSRLQNSGYPYAAVEARSEAHPAEQVVDVTLEATPGIEGRLGEITIHGADRVRERFVTGALGLREGDPYSLDALQAAQRRLFQLGTFSVATVEPRLDDPARTEVPIDVEVREARFRTFRIGGGFTLDSFLPIARAQARLQHVNLLRELIRADVGVRAGAAFDPGRGFSWASAIPIWGADLRLEYPRLLGQRASLELNASVDRDIYTGLWEYLRPAGDLAFVYRFSDVVQARIGPHVEDYTFLGGLGEDLNIAQQRLFGIDGDALRYQLTALDQYFTVDWRDDPIRATRGGYLQLAVREAVPLSSAGFGFVRTSVDARRYVSFRARDPAKAVPFTLAGRIAATYILPYGDTKQIPLPERAFLGGPTGIRGFRPNQVGPYTTLCAYRSDDSLARYHIPQGGNVAGQASVEGRYDTSSDLTLAAFVDVGALAGDASELGADDLRGSAGAGVRYDTAVGPIRLDLSLRPFYPEDDGPFRFTGCADGDAVPRAFDLPSALGADRPLPFAVVFYLTFGEAL
jgi:translocation and assembly module TamA